MSVKEFCLRSFFFSFVAPVLAATIVIGLVCRWLHADFLYSWGVLVLFIVALSKIQDRFVFRKYELACRDCDRKWASGVFWQKKNCVCGGEITVRDKEQGEEAK